jgi:hypothetical protein
MTETTWHYNLVRYPSGDLGIHEFYVDHSPEGDKISWTEKAVSAYGDTPEEVAEVLETMKKDILKHKILDLKTGRLEG